MHPFLRLHDAAQGSRIPPGLGGGSRRTGALEGYNIGGPETPDCRREYSEWESAAESHHVGILVIVYSAVGADIEIQGHIPVCPQLAAEHGPILCMALTIRLVWHGLARWGVCRPREGEAGNVGPCEYDRTLLPYLPSLTLVQPYLPL